MEILLSHIKDFGLGSKGNWKPLRRFTYGSGLIRFTILKHHSCNVGEKNGRAGGRMKDELGKGCSHLGDSGLLLY